MYLLPSLAGLIVVFWIPAHSAEYNAEVNTTYGPIRGQEDTYKGIEYLSFKGIPYAAPPVGELRFAPPQPPKKWTDVRDATTFGNICPQIKYNVSNKKHGCVGVHIGVSLIATPFQQFWSPSPSEDCLSLNVYTQTLEESSLKPVLFWIHGGGFIVGDGTDSVFGPQYLIGKDIVIVTINYRLGPLGFLSTKSTDVSGNWGLKDQVAALQWVQENIVHFGGDPQKVTIYGESAGAISAHLHMFSPLAKGLFSKVIASSGSATTGEIFRTQEKIDEYSQNLARILGAPESDIESPVKMMEFLRGADAQKISELGLKAGDDEVFEDPGQVTGVHDDVLPLCNLQHPLFETLPFLPVIEPLGTEGAYITEKPIKLLEEGRFTKVPLMMGVNDLEGGIVFMGLGKKGTLANIKKVEENICQSLPIPLMEAIMAKNECSQVAKEIGDTYFDGKPFGSSMLSFIYICGDLLFTLAVHVAQRLHARITKQDPPIYSYYFTFDGKWNIVKMYANISLPGATHSEDLAYVFRPVLPMGGTETSPEIITKNRMVTLLTNFVKYGDPTPTVTDLIPVKWEPASETEPITLVIGNELKLENEFLKARMDMWDNLYKEYTGKALFS